ncbi:MAG TPA: NUDIX domain-containing protein, partial [Acidimicrobiales bacterium]|nr:NUDIX domain-containing protein [Acidimicrobiales bacterium]
GAAGVEIVLVHHRLHGDWSIPKGKQEPDEEIDQCAIREVLEETGLHGEADHQLGIFHYTDRIGRLKAVHYWSMHAGDSEDLHALAPTLEIDEAKWMTIDEALPTVNFSRDRLVLWTFAGLIGHAGLEKGVPDDDNADSFAGHGPVLLLRHASAGERGSSNRNDSLRPLDPKGLAQADRIATNLSHFPIYRIITSPATRCIQTVIPLAGKLGLPIEVDEELNEGSYDTIGSKLLEYRNSGVLACTHGDVLEGALRFVALECNLPLPGDGNLKKASTWIFNGAIEGGNTTSSTGPFKVAGYLGPPSVKGDY